MVAVSTARRADGLLWAQVADALEQQVGAGEPGERLPSEAALTKRFGISRVTLRQALGSLEQRGLVHPQAGRGWFVGAIRMEPRVHEEAGVLQSFTDMARSRGLTPSSVVLHCERRPADYEEARELSVAPGADVLSLRRVRELDGYAVAVDHSLVPASLLPHVGAGDFADGSLYAVLGERGVRPVRADYEVRAVAADAEHAALLGVDLGAPLLAAHQVSSDERGRRIERGDITYRGDRYRFRAVLRA